MKTISFSCEDAAFDLAATALCTTYGYQPTVPDPDHPGQTMQNPVTPGEFARAQIVKFIQETTVGYIARTKDAEAKAATLALAQQQVYSVEVIVSVA